MDCIEEMEAAKERILANVDKHRSAIKRMSEAESELAEESANVYEALRNSGVQMAVIDKFAAAAPKVMKAREKFDARKADVQRLSKLISLDMEWLKCLRVIAGQNG